MLPSCWRTAAHMGRYTLFAGTSFIMSVEASYLQMDQDEFDAQMAASAPEKRRFSSRFAFLGSSSKANKGNEPIAATARRGANTAEEARSNAAKSF